MFLNWINTYRSSWFYNKKYINIMVSLSQLLQVCGENELLGSYMLPWKLAPALSPAL